MRKNPYPCSVRASNSGVTLVELMVAMVIFLIFIALALPAFTFISNKVGEVQARQELNKKGQRVLEYIAEEVRLAGLFVGGNPAVTFCGEANPTNSLVHTAGNPYDTLVFLTSEQATTSTGVGDPFLRLTATAATGTATFTVNEARNTNSRITPDPDPADNNGRSFITFDSLAPTILNRAYRVSTYNLGSTSLTVSPPLEQAINANSNIYLVARKRISVNGRDLQMVRWNANCSLNPDNLIAAHDRQGGTAWGGVDALQFEYVMSDGTVTGSISAADITNVRAVNIWILLRADFPERDFTNTTVYTVGTNGLAGTISVGPFNDSFRRMVVSKRVEVKNLEK
ncbi:MAG: hypothetical protein OHK006_09540 [Thermodesulfovibrionales bacterium]